MKLSDIDFSVLVEQLSKLYDTVENLVIASGSRLSGGDDFKSVQAEAMAVVEKTKKFTERVEGGSYKGEASFGKFSEGEVNEAIALASELQASNDKVLEVVGSQGGQVDFSEEFEYSVNGETKKANLKSLKKEVDNSVNQITTTLGADGIKPISKVATDVVGYSNPLGVMRVNHANLETHEQEFINQATESARKVVNTQSNSEDISGHSTAPVIDSEIALQPPGDPSYDAEKAITGVKTGTGTVISAEKLAQTGNYGDEDYNNAVMSNMRNGIREYNKKYGTDYKLGIVGEEGHQSYAPVDKSTGEPAGQDVAARISNITYPNDNGYSPEGIFDHGEVSAFESNNVNKNSYSTGSSSNSEPRKTALSSEEAKTGVSSNNGTTIVGDDARNLRGFLRATREYNKVNGGNIGVKSVRGGDGAQSFVVYDKNTGNEVDDHLKKYIYSEGSRLASPSAKTITEQSAANIDTAESLEKPVTSARIFEHGELSEFEATNGASTSTGSESQPTGKTGYDAEKAKTGVSSESGNPGSTQMSTRITTSSSEVVSKMISATEEYNASRGTNYGVASVGGWIKFVDYNNGGKEVREYQDRQLHKMTGLPSNFKVSNYDHGELSDFEATNGVGSAVDPEEAITGVKTGTGTVISAEKLAPNSEQTKQLDKETAFRVGQTADNEQGDKLDAEGRYWASQKNIGDAGWPVDGAQKRFHSARNTSKINAAIEEYNESRGTNFGFKRDNLGHMQLVDFDKEDIPITPSQKYILYKNAGLNYRDMLKGTSVDHGELSDFEKTNGKEVVASSGVGQSEENAGVAQGPVVDWGDDSDKEDAKRRYKKIKESGMPMGATGEDGTTTVVTGFNKETGSFESTRAPDMEKAMTGVESEEPKTKTTAVASTGNTSEESKVSATTRSSGRKPTIADKPIPAVEDETIVGSIDPPKFGGNVSDIVDIPPALPAPSSASEPPRRRTTSRRRSSRSKPKFL